MMKMVFPIQSEPKNTVSIFYSKDAERELVVSFFGECNLRCEFCCDYFRLDKKYNKNSVQSRLNQTITALRKIDSQKIKIKMFGGEMFMDKLDDSVFDEYSHYIETIKNECNKLGKSVRFAVTSNLVFHKRERVLKFLKKYSIELRTSFDLEGRFHSERVLQIFMENVKWFSSKQYEVKITMVFTKKSIDHLINNGLYKKYWDALYKNYSLSLEYYTDVGIDGYSMSEDDEYKALVYMYKHYPKVKLVETLVNSYKSYGKKNKYCIKGVWIDDYTVYQCCDLNQINAEFLKKKQCFLCKHYAYCPGTCARIHQYEYICHIKKFFDFLENEQQ